MNLKKKFYETDLKTRVVYYIFCLISVCALIFANLFYFLKNDSVTAYLLVELSVIMLNIGVWGAVFFDVMAKKIKNF